MSTCWMCLSWSRWVLCAKRSKYMILLEEAISKPPYCERPGSRNACHFCQASRGLVQLWLCEAVQNWVEQDWQEAQTSMVQHTTEWQRSSHQYDAISTEWQRSCRSCPGMHAVSMD